MARLRGSEHASLFSISETLKLIEKGNDVQQMKRDLKAIIKYLDAEVAEIKPNIVKRNGKATEQK